MLALLGAWLLELDGIPVLAYTPEALLGLTVVLVLTGQLQPKRTVDLLLKAAAKRDEQLDKLLASVDTSNKLAEAIVEHAARDRRSDSS